jgi:hypothetical protein
MTEWNDWSEGWIKEGYYLSYRREGVLYYEHVIGRDFGHWEYDWPETIVTLTTSGPFVPADLEITRGYDKASNSNQIWQMLFGIKGQVFIYVELPTDIHRHGIPKVPKPSTTMRRTSHFTEWMSPFTEPSFITEHFMMRPETSQIAFDAYNPGTINHTDVTLNIMLNKMVTERIGTVENGTQNPTYSRFTQLLDKLHNQNIPCRPISVMPVRAPAEAPGGE